MTKPRLEKRMAAAPSAGKPQGDKNPHIKCALCDVFLHVHKIFVHNPFCIDQRLFEKSKYPSFSTKTGRCGKLRSGRFF
ncbi:hypothetical protein D3Z39_05035 [Anaerotruncus colihominis]|uniref:Uncharacterized protein n=1 Tax=Anaerotruncus colihominis TaxID=169435 RepID=A0A845RDZ7_9FIRM|nr:hypothetical protein [Anaerotruncus colihominis]